MSLFQRFNAEQLEDLQHEFKSINAMDEEQFVRVSLQILRLSPFEKGGFGLATATDVEALQSIFSRADCDSQLHITWDDLVNVLSPDTDAAGSSTGKKEAMSDNAMLRQSQMKAAATKQMVMERDDDAMLRTPPGLHKVSRVRVFENIHLIVMCFQDSDRIAFYRMVPECPHDSEEQYIGQVKLTKDSSLTVLDVCYHEDAMVLFVSVGGFSIHAYDIMGMIQYNQRMFDRSQGDTTDKSDIKPQPIGAAVSHYMCKFIQEVHAPTPHSIMFCIAGTTKFIGCTPSGNIVLWYLHISRAEWTHVEITMYPRGSLLLHNAPINDAVFIHELGLFATGCGGGTLGFWAIQGLSNGVGGTRGVHEDHFDMTLFSKPGMIVDGVYLLRKFTEYFPFGCRVLGYLPTSQLLLATGFSPVIHIFDMSGAFPVLAYSMNTYGDNISAFLPLERGHPFNATTNAAVDPFRGSILSVDDGSSVRWWNLAKDDPALSHDRCIQDVRVGSGRGGGLTCVFPVVCRTGRPIIQEPVEHVASQLFSTHATSEHAGEGAAVIASPPIHQEQSMAIMLAGNSKVGVVFHPAMIRDAAETLICHPVSTQTIILLSQASTISVEWMSAEVGVRTFPVPIPKISVHQPAISGDGKRFFTGHVDGSIRVFDAQSGRYIRSLTAHTQEVTSLVYLPDYQMLMSVSIDGLIQFHAEQQICDELHTTSKKERNIVGQNVTHRILHAHGKDVQVTAATYCVRKRIFVTGDGGGAIRLWNVDSLACNMELRLHDYEVKYIAHLEVADRYLSVDIRGNMAVWDIDNKVGRVVCQGVLENAGRGASNRQNPAALGSISHICNLDHILVGAAHANGEVSFWKVRHIAPPEGHIQYALGQCSRRLNITCMDALMDYSSEDSAPVRVGRIEILLDASMLVENLRCIVGSASGGSAKLGTPSINVCGYHRNYFCVGNALGDVLIINGVAEVVNCLSVSAVTQRPTLLSPRTPWHGAHADDASLRSSQQQRANQLLTQLARDGTKRRLATCEGNMIPGLRIGDDRSEAGSGDMPRAHIYAALKEITPKKRVVAKLNDDIVDDVDDLRREEPKPVTYSAIARLKSPKVQTTALLITRPDAYQRMQAEAAHWQERRHAVSLSEEEIVDKSLRRAVVDKSKPIFMESPGVRALTFSCLQDVHDKLDHKSATRTQADDPSKTVTSQHTALATVPDSAVSVPLPGPPIKTYKPMSAAEHFELCLKGRVGGQYKRDVDLIRGLLERVDPLKKGLIRFDDLKQQLGNLSHFVYMGKQIEMLFRSADKHSRGVLSLEEFVRVTFPKATTPQMTELVRYFQYKGPSNEELRKTYVRGNPQAMELLHAMFETFDSDKSGTIDASELEAVLKTLSTTESMSEAKERELAKTVREMFAEVDTSGDNVISFDEFVDAIGPYIEMD